MKYTILGFSQEELIKNGMDLKDALMLRWFIDFKDTSKMKAKIIGGIPYYWVLYDKVLSDIPAIRIKNRETLYRRFNKLATKEILKHKTVKSGGTFSYYAIGPKYESLIYNSKSTQKSNPYDSKVGTKINLLKIRKKKALKKSQTVDKQEKDSVSGRGSIARYVPKVISLRTREEPEKKTCEEWTESILLENE